MCFIFNPDFVEPLPLVVVTADLFLVPPPPPSPEYIIMASVPDKADLHKRRKGRFTYIKRMPHPLNCLLNIPPPPPPPPPINNMKLTFQKVGLLPRPPPARNSNSP